MATSAKRIYWDSCTFLGLINEEADKHAACRNAWTHAEKGAIEIWTSFYSFAEVFKAKCEGKAKPTDEEEEKIDRLFQNDFIVPVPVDRRIALLARRLMRKHPECKKPQDGVHLATALVHNVLEMHTFDGSDLLDLDGKVARADGEKLTICQPYIIAPDIFDEKR